MESGRDAAIATNPERGRSAGFVLDELVIVAAADQLELGALPERIKDRLRSQLAAADLVVLTKTDLMEDAGDAARFAIAGMASGVPMFDGGRDRAGPGSVGHFLALGGGRPGGVTAVPAPTLFDAHDVQVLPVPDQLDRAGLERWLGALPVTGRVVRAELEPATDLVVISLRD